MENYYESDAPFYSALRSVGSRVGGWFDENDMGRVIRAMRELDPEFGMDSFQRELREYIVPEVVDAYLSADRDSLKEWMGEAVSRSLVVKLTAEFQRVLGDYRGVHQARLGLRFTHPRHRLHRRTSLSERLITADPLRSQKGHSSTKRYHASSSLSRHRNSCYSDQLWMGPPWWVARTRWTCVGMRSW